MSLAKAVLVAIVSVALSCTTERAGPDGSQTAQAPKAQEPALRSDVRSALGRLADARSGRRTSLGGASLSAKAKELQEAYDAETRCDLLYLDTALQEDEMKLLVQELIKQEGTLDWFVVEMVAFASKGPFPEQALVDSISREDIVAEPYKTQSACRQRFWSVMYRYLGIKSQGHMTLGQCEPLDSIVNPEQGVSDTVLYEYLYAYCDEFGWN